MIEQKGYMDPENKWEYHFEILKHQYGEKANEVAMAQWSELIEEIRMFMDDQQPDVLYSFSSYDGIIAGKGKHSFTIDFYPPASTFSARILRLRNQIVLAMSTTECGTNLYNLLDSLCIIVLYALYDDESGPKLMAWQSEYEQIMTSRLGNQEADDMKRKVLEEILI